MKILFSLLAFCLFASCVHSQEAVDTVSVRVQYRALYKHTQEQKEAYDDINLLDIGRHSSRFYSQRFEQFLHQRDSVKSMNTDPISYLQFLANTFGSKKGCGYEVYKPEFGIRNTFKKLVISIIFSIFVVENQYVINKEYYHYGDYQRQNYRNFLYYR